MKTYSQNIKHNFILFLKGGTEESCSAHHMPLKLLCSFHEIQAKLAKEELPTVVVFRRKRGEVPSLNLIFSKLNRCYVLHFRELFMLTQTCCIQLFMTLQKNILKHRISSQHK